LLTDLVSAMTGGAAIDSGKAIESANSQGAQPRTR
jgi:hypothetical protein